MKSFRKQSQIRSIFALISCGFCSGIEKVGFHSKNLHRYGYDFQRYSKEFPAIRQHLILNPNGIETINFGDPVAVQCLNSALLKVYYGVNEWTLPAAYLCPPIPSRADYLHRISDLLHELKMKEVDVKCLDIGVGASCIYPLIGSTSYNWTFVGTDVDQGALASSQAICNANPQLGKTIELRMQKDKSKIFKEVVQDPDQFTFCMANPPFHANLDAAKSGTLRKWKNLERPVKNSKEPLLNFSGSKHELVCDGGEVGFISRMITESVDPYVHSRVQLFTALVSKSATLPPLLRLLHSSSSSPQRRSVSRAEVKVVEMRHGQKSSRILAWWYRGYQQHAVC